MKSKFVAFGLILAAGLATAAEQPSLELIMSDPDWIGNAPQSPYWSDSGDSIYYSQKQVGEDFSQLFRLTLPGGETLAVDESRSPADSGRDKIYNSDRSAVAWLERGDIFLKDLKSKQSQRITATVSDESHLQFSADDNSLQFLRDEQFFSFDLQRGSLRQLTDIRLSDDPKAEQARFDVLRAQQARTYRSLVESAQRSERREAAEQLRAQHPKALYLGKNIRVLARSLSPNGEQLALVVSDASDDTGRAGSMPNYLTADGYVTVREVRSRVGRNTERAQDLLIVDLSSNKISKVDWSSLPGIDQDPLAKLRLSALKWHLEQGANEAEVKQALTAPEQRGLSVTQLKWSPNGQHLALQLLANDFKDRWLVSYSPAAAGAQLKLQHRLSDEAWINWEYNDFGWLSDSRSLWFLSEESGYSHLYRKAFDEKRATALSSGQFVVREPAIAPAEDYAYLVANRAHPGNYHVYRVPLSGGALEQVSDLDGVSSFVLSPNSEQLLISRSWFDRHEDLYLGASDGSQGLKRLTDTVSARYREIDWIIPKIVEVPSSHSERPIYSKLYLPADHDPNKRYPALMFVHGAGYTQNAHFGWPYYFREFMFHTVLSNAGYVVLDMDYRASQGYGRDWRTSIYRNMGQPELEDFLDGIDYLVEQQGVERHRVGIYGGSYGGFMTFMALFKAPEAFAAGAALRPVVDWMHYENDYTQRILNTPLIDPEAYQRSSPINHAAGLEKPLLITSGMQDDNVFFQDSVLMVQRLLELKKPDFEIAIYPLEGHGFSNPESWLDQYRRIFKLMQKHLQ
ncbi:S9 family peptidase [Parahaliea sp. F7430]|uniref:S9 family peptidase n=1 Tax=Sediminihaliea albiluteola TaxID=2758564 RepID=A0A7W2TVG8_9GAMM|nr:prolyl oligopeptidase family serine peptidase [Sediminihaliea albiluteola]MBA6412633.1 S9 family peptidase [Sediminihaliea albiluteola]